MPRRYDVWAPLLTVATVWLALLSWRSFTADPHSYLAPAAFLGVVIVGVGALGRAVRLRTPLVVLAQLVIGGLVTDAVIFGSPLPLSSGARAHVVDVFNTAYDTVTRSDLPVRVGDGGIAPYLLLGAAAAFLLGDLLANRLHRPPLAGLVLLAIFSVPFSIVGGGVAWWVFALTAAGFLALLALQQAERIAHWGRHLGDTAAAGIAADPVGARSPARVRSRAVGPGAIGLAATACAIVVPVFVPTLHLDLSGFGPGSGGGGPIRVTNPTVGMYDDLKNRSDTPLVYVHTGRGAATPPAYLRIATLTSFNGTEWTPGGRSIPPSHTAHTSFDPPEGDGALLGAPTTYTLTATPDFQSKWLPTFYYPTRVDAAGDWRYDDDTLDFISGDRGGGLTTAGETWTVTSAPVQPPQDLLLAAPFTTNGVPAAYTALPDLPAEFGRIARERTAAESTPFAKAVALQDWFHSSGEFTYSLDRPGGTGRNDLLHFVTDQKIGYCQQFATAMAAMARELGIPARVAVGFLNPTAMGGGNYVFRARDMHAWPELWFQGVGWVRFEPTPAAADTSVPGYTIGVLGGQGGDDTGSQTTQGPGSLPTQNVSPNHRGDVPQPGANDTTSPSGANASDDGGHGWLVAVAVVAGLLLLVGASVGLPLWVRLRRRSRRLHGGAEDGWAELRDSVRDLGLPWSDDLSPRSAGRQLHGHLRGATARDALERIVVAVERSRYARVASQEPIGDDVRLVVEALREDADPASRRRSGLWPRSVMSTRRRQPAPRPEQERELVDHMG
ncbi:transglutaminaseTgpA domain-containing protein [Nocardioides sp. DS6]|uniref:TransglutaminaseTgpA domain-containing protein n=1 Tax=Nocardioides eburneus TaxID=3231482 RepID=A0ABV3SX08_9ACTN